MGTLCKNCPLKGIKTETDSCTTLFAKKYHNSCVTYDITEHKGKQEREKFIKELEEFTNEKKTSEILDEANKVKKVSKPRKSRKPKEETENKNIETKETIAEIVSSVANAAVACENNNKTV